MLSSKAVYIVFSVITLLNLCVIALAIWINYTLLPNRHMLALRKRYIEIRITINVCIILYSLINIILMYYLIGAKSYNYRHTLMKK